MDINQLIQFLKAQNNPSLMVMSMLETQSANNPVFGNLLNLAKNNDVRGIEQFARNMMKERGLDFDTEFNNFRKTYHL